MAYEEIKSPKQAHRLTMDDCQKLWMSGVEEVESFDEGEVAVHTVRGLMYVRGRGLKVDKLEKTSGELTISGEVTGLEYMETVAGGGFLARLFH